ncbi:coiled-coil domain-containing protein 82 [Amia ocellicauda]|uniref:coiled-coil domain-containing protein 82 n=1 Tax=Amia ocellicauda TaxID=2972642 RepID=UPI003464669A
MDGGPHEDCHVRDRKNSQKEDVCDLPKKQTRASLSHEGFESLCSSPNAGIYRETNPMPSGIQSELDMTGTEISEQSPESSNLGQVEKGGHQCVANESPDKPVQSQDERDVTVHDHSEQSSQEEDIHSVKSRYTKRNVITDSQESALETDSRKDIDGSDDDKDSEDDESSQEETTKRKKCWKRVKMPASEPSSLETECFSVAEQGDSGDSSSGTDLDIEDYEKQREEVRKLFQENGIPVVGGNDFEACFQNVIKAFVTDAVKGNFLASLYGGGSKSDFEMKKSLDHLDEHSIVPRLKSLKPGGEWNARYMRRLDSFPSLRMRNQSPIESTCQACHQNRMLTHQITLTGLFYDLKTLKEDPFLSEEKRVLEIGNLCAERTRLYHQLRHFKFDLYKKCCSKVKSVEENGHQKAKEADIEPILSRLKGNNWINEQRLSLTKLMEETDKFMEKKLPAKIDKMRKEWGHY